MRWTKGCLGGLALMVGMVSWTWAGGWPRLEEVVTAWGGLPVVVLATREGNPVEAPLDLELIELLTRHGFEVRTAPPAEEVRAEGLVFEVRAVDDDVAVVVRRASDRTIIGFERHGTETAPLAAPVAVADKPSFGGVWPLGGHPVQLSAVDAGPPGEGVEVALMGGGRLDVVRLGAQGPRVVDSWVPPVRPARGLRLDARDLDGDGAPDLVTTWAEDVESIYEGVHSEIHGWVLGGTPLAPEGGPWGGYLRIVEGRVWTQKRAANSPFAADDPAPVRSPSKDGGTGSRWLEGRNLYEVTPWGGRWVGWTRNGRLAVMTDGGEVVSSVDFGPWAGPSVSVRLAEPEFRSGFEKEDRVNDRQVVLARRVVVGGDGAVYLVRRGRREGGLLVGRSAGADAVVRASLRGNEIVTELPFGEEETFILDFDLLPGKAGVVLLLNESADGSGQAHVAVRRFR